MLVKFFLSFDEVFAAYVKAEGGCLFATYVQAEGGCCKGETTPAAPLPHSTQFSRGENRGGSQSPASEPAVHTPVPDNFRTPVPDNFHTTGPDNFFGSHQLRREYVKKTSAMRLIESSVWWEGAWQIGESESIILWNMPLILQTANILI